MKVYLIGYMASGKTTVGRKLARMLNFDFIDMDDVFEGKYHIQINDFFEKYDERAFREIESKLIKETSKLDQVVISTGGGAPCFYDNLEWMKQAGLTVYLQMGVASLVNRLSNAKRIRPLIKSMDRDELKDFISEQLKIRAEYYEKAQIIVQGQNCNIDTLASSIRLHPLFK